MTPKVENVGTNATTNGTKNSRPAQIIVKNGDTLGGLAKKYGLSVEEFKTWAGIKSVGIKAGQKINLPMDTVPEGSGIFSLIRKYGMTLDEFGKLNNLPKPYKEYVAKKGEQFYIRNHSNNKTGQTTKTQPAPKQKTIATKPTSSGNGMSRIQQNKAKWGSSYTPDELSQKIFQKSGEYYGAVGKPDFDALINEINPKNASAIIKAYTNNPKNGSKESIIDTIVSEIRSDKNKRKEAVMKIYDALAQEKGTPAAIRVGFMKELNEQFDSFGWVSTKRLDETINRMMATPKQLASKMEKDIDSKNGAINSTSFQELLAFITPKNASAVIKEYDKIGKGESLIKAITHEVSNSQEIRKKAVMHIYDALAKEKHTPASKRAEFEKELNAQFNSFGMVDTKKLDSMISKMIESSTVTNTRKTNTTQRTSGTKPKANPNEEVIKGGYKISTGGKISVASNGNLPKIPVNEKGDVIAEVIKFKPSNPNGPLKGKTIMVNAGHGWRKDKIFDPGTHAKDSNNKDIPEWYKNRNFADKLITELSNQGATVIYTTGNVNLVCDAKRNYKADMLISLHCNSAGNPNARGLEVLYPDGSKSSERLAQMTEHQLDELVSFGPQDGANDHCRTRADADTPHKSLGILQVNKETTPSILIEMGFQSNENDLKNIDSQVFRKNSMEKVTNAIKQYFNV